MNHQYIIGTWSLKSFIAQGPNGDQMFPLGESATGLLTYTDSGYMSAAIMKKGRKKFVSGFPFEGTPEEIKEAFEGFSAYSGSYVLDEMSETITHYVEVSNFPNEEGMVHVRYAKCFDNYLQLTTPPIRVIDQDWVLILLWRRTSPVTMTSP